MSRMSLHIEPYDLQGVVPAKFEKARCRSPSRAGSQPRHLTVLIRSFFKALEVLPRISDTLLRSCPTATSTAVRSDALSQSCSMVRAGKPVFSLQQISAQTNYEEPIYVLYICNLFMFVFAELPVSSRGAASIFTSRFVRKINDYISFCS